jgi:hypothetical protein|nr:MAG TPA: hypothetical protein [Caudoviricetes sp.]
MKLKRTIAVALKDNEKMQVPDGELWVGYIDNKFVVEIVGADATKVTHLGFNNSLASSRTSDANIDHGRVNRFYATPGSQIVAAYKDTFGESYAFICLVFDISKEVNNV